MADSQYKVLPLPLALKPGQPSAAASVSFPSALMRDPWRTALRGPDNVPAARRRIVTQHTGGSSEWCSGNFTVGGGSQEYPAPDVWRTVCRSRFELGPGCALQVNVIAVRSGQTEITSGGGWAGYGAGGRVRVSLSYENTSADTATASAELALPASIETDAWEPTTAGGSWGALLFASAVLVHPAAALGSASEQAKWSEWPTVDVVVEHLGGARVIQCELVEVPREHVVVDTVEESSLHGWPATQQIPTPRPAIEDKDGASFDEHRFGTHRGLHVAARQTERAGPIIAQWSSYAEALAEVADTENDAIAITSKSWVGVSLGSSITTWDANNPGHDVAGHYARPVPENLAERLDGAAAIPVRARVWARFTTTGSNTGRVKLQTSARSWLIVKVPQSASTTTYAWHEAIGWVESTDAVDDGAVNLQDFGKVTGGTMEIRDWAVQFGEFEVA